MHDDVWAHQCRCGWSVRVPTLALLQFRTAEHRAMHDDVDRLAEFKHDGVDFEVVTAEREAVVREMARQRPGVVL